MRPADVLTFGSGISRFFFGRSFCPGRAALAARFDAEQAAGRAQRPQQRATSANGRNSPRKPAKTARPWPRKHAKPC